MCGYCKFWLRKVAASSLCRGYAPAIFLYHGRGLNYARFIKEHYKYMPDLIFLCGPYLGIRASNILGFVLAFLCLAASVLVLQSVSSDIWSEVKQQQDLKRERQLYRDYEKNRYGYICPCCGYPAGERVDNKEEGYTYRCRNCRYIW